MHKPKLIVVTGLPASGKSTLARVLSKELKCPLISRDELKEGYLNTIGFLQEASGITVNGHIYETFFQTIDLLLSKGISIVVEAAFRHKVWQPKLIAFLESADVKIIVCEINTELAKLRFAQRSKTNSDREKYHGESSTKPVEENVRLLFENFEYVKIQAPTLIVNTTEHYHPSLEYIIDFINHQNSH